VSIVGIDGIQKWCWSNYIKIHMIHYVLLSDPSLSSGLNWVNTLILCHVFLGIRGISIQAFMALCCTYHSCSQNNACHVFFEWHFAQNKCLQSLTKAQIPLGPSCHEWHDVLAHIPTMPNDTATSLQRSSLECSFGYNTPRTIDPIKLGCYNSIV